MVRSGADRGAPQSTRVVGVPNTQSSSLAPAKRSRFVSRRRAFERLCKTLKQDVVEPRRPSSESVVVVVDELLASEPLDGLVVERFRQGIQ